MPVPRVMPLDDWLKHKGQPQALPPPDDFSKDDDPDR
jgi:hypothetical protein